MFGLGMPELVIILLVLFVIFGAKRLPDLGKGLGEGIRSFRKAFKGQDEDDAKSPPPMTPQEPPRSAK